jgi:tryptophanyl-tRNA synthetase
MKATETLKREHRVIEQVASACAEVLRRGTKVRIVSGIQPTGELHIGNYFGALRHWVALQSEGECFFMLADLHAITTPQNPAELRERIVNTAALLLAIGIDPARSVFLLQSRVPQHTELSWVLNCFTSMGELRRMAQFKDKAVRGGESAATAVVRLSGTPGCRHTALPG